MNRTLDPLKPTHIKLLQSLPVKVPESVLCQIRDGHVIEGEALCLHTSQFVPPFFVKGLKLDFLDDRTFVDVQDSFKKAFEKETTMRYIDPFFTELWS